MLRALFFAIGAFVALTGGGLFVVDRVVLTESARQTIEQKAPGMAPREIDPPAWLPYTCSSCGVLTMLYALALPRKDH